MLLTIEEKRKIYIERSRKLERERGIIFGDDRTGNPGSARGCNLDAFSQLVSENILEKDDLIKINKIAIYKKSN